MINDPENRFDLIEPKRMFRRVDETDAVTGIGKKLAPRGNRLENPASTFLAEFTFGNAFDVGHQPNQ